MLWWELHAVQSDVLKIIAFLEIDLGQCSFLTYLLLSFYVPYHQTGAIENKSHENDTEYQRKTKR